MSAEQEPVLVCKDLCISYYTRAGEIPARGGFFTDGQAR
jgi:hypothetical protein